MVPDILFKLLLGLVIGFFIGAERESRRKDAGISTHSMVIVGALIFTHISLLQDPTSKNIAAQIVSGIGFLGAGLIIKDGGSIRNLTTAASIWSAGAVGMAIGFGYYLEAVVAGLVIALIPRIPHISKINSD